MQQAMHPVRLTFEKRGRAIYISHLDLMRAMSRAVRRAALPLWYTEGFHPHPYLSFPLPLPLGQEALREAVDLRLLEPMPPDEIVRRMNEALPGGLRVLRAGEPWCGAGEIAAAEYEISFVCKDIETTRQAMAAGSLTIKKMGKQGHRKVEKEIALAPLLVSYELTQGNDRALLGCVLAAGSERNLNPALLVEALGGEAPRICRTRLLRGDGQEWE
ncbi:MAG: TIGR03936 family radical SAM-associated protein [Oscillospiraceae bacterium]|jgi:radical SAM-linked protein|nr:TIGR03936 family radical SAM-associated protein [Oscillospiraceae bacterium]